MAGPRETEVFSEVEDLGRMGYAEAYAVQLARHELVLAARGWDGSAGGVVLLVEHDPVITVSRRAGASGHLVATQAALRAAGVEVCATDRGGDITYHGPGQLVVYPIVDLNRLGLRLHEYMRALESAVIAACARFGLEAHRDADATGVWTSGPAGRERGHDAKVCAMGVRVRRWVTLHGLALNVTTDLQHFELIVPCGLVGRGVTSLKRELGSACPSMNEVKRVVVEELGRALSG